MFSSVLDSEYAISQPCTVLLCWTVRVSLVNHVLFALFDSECVSLILFLCIGK